jgi:predicted trehalose synthase
MDAMSTWFSRMANRLATLLDPHTGPWNLPSPDWGDVDADVRRLRHELDAIRMRFPDRR